MESQIAVETSVLSFLKHDLCLLLSDLWNDLFQKKEKWFIRGNAEPISLAPKNKKII